jgi:hypothetical protein
MASIGHHRWQVRIHITKAMLRKYRSWVVGVRVGHKLTLISITILP